MVIAVASVVLVRLQSDSCRAIDTLVEFNDSQTQWLESLSNSPAAGSYDEPLAPTMADYQIWADGLARNAADVIEPKAAAEHARRAAELTGQIVEVIHQIRSGDYTHHPLDPLPPSIEAYMQIGQEFDAEMSALQNTCP